MIFMSLFCYNCEDERAVELHFQSKQYHQTLCSFYTKLVCLYPSQGCVLVQGNELLCWGVHAVGIKAVDSCGGESMSSESGAVDFPPGES